MPPSLEPPSRKSSSGSSSTVRPSAFHYDPKILAQCQDYLLHKNYHGLALIARQKGVPPFLRFKIWPLLLRHHPFVANPFIQPDTDVLDKEKSELSESEDDNGLRRKIRKDLRRYMHRIAYSLSEEPLSETELRVFDILETSVHKFVAKWGQIIKYDLALTWIALGLAEWFPPIPHTPWVLLGRDVSSNSHTCIGSLLDDYNAYTDSVGIDMDVLVQDGALMSFHEVFERLALVLLHLPESANKGTQKLVKIDKLTLPINGGTIEERVSFFIYVLQKLLPELSKCFQEEQILNKFGLHDDEWLIWWLKYCGSKVWSRVDRGRVWDLLLGWRVPSKKSDNVPNYYADKLNMPAELLLKLGPDVFWSVDYDENEAAPLRKADLFKDLMNGLHIEPVERKKSDAIEESETAATTGTSSSSSGASSPVLSTSSASTTSSFLGKGSIPFSSIDPHIELLFVSLALLKAKENTLVELDQHEIRTFLSRLPAKSFSPSDKYKQYQEQKDKEKGAVPKEKGAAPAEHAFRYDYMDSIINEAGELWRKWLWREMSGEN